MRLNKQWLFVIFIALVWGYANTVIAATRYVPSQYATIQAAIDAAANGDIVLVADGTYTDTELSWTGKHLTVKSENGPENCIIDCSGGTKTSSNNGNAFLFNETGQDATDVINGFTIINGKARYGGGIYLYYSSPTITNCIFGNGEDRNHAEYGGGIYCEYSSPAVTNCTFTDNGAKCGGGIYCEYSSPAVTNCTFIDNGAEYGGGIYCEYSSPAVTNCTFIDNDAGVEGGGICISSSFKKDLSGKIIPDEVYSSPTITNCTFTGNYADEVGGGIYCYYSSPTITNCIIGGTVRNDKTDNGDGNYAEYGGGGIYCYISSATITNCTIAGNYVDDGDGGGIYTNGGDVRKDIDGKPISPEVSHSPIITSCTIVNNYADYDGGGIACDYSSPTITDCTIEDNESDDQGGGIYCDYYSSPTVTNSEIIWNDADYGAGGIAGYNGSSLTITNCTIADNEVGAGGSGINCNASYALITNCTIADNYAYDLGAGILTYNAFLTIKNSILWGNDNNPGNTYHDQIRLHHDSILSIDYSDVEDGEDGINTMSSSTYNWGDGNIEEDPLFVNADFPGFAKNKDGVFVEDYHLDKDSPCIDVGINEGAPTNDIDGQTRPFNKIVDIGSDEYTWSSPIDTAFGSGTGNLDLDKGALTELELVNEVDLGDTGKPELTFPFGLLSFKIVDIEEGDSVIVALTFPQNVPTSAIYWKYGPTLTDPTDHWYQFPFGSNDGDNIITLTLTDGADGDSDLTANGVIIDPGGIGFYVVSGAGSSGGSGGKSCFIATACFGTSSADEVMTLRHFRDECLLSNPVGTIFVNTYYKVSPPVADFIGAHPLLKNIVRQTLKPLIWMSEKLIE